MDTAACALSICQPNSTRSFRSPAFLTNRLHCTCNLFLLFLASYRSQERCSQRCAVKNKAANVSSNSAFKISCFAIIRARDPTTRHTFPQPSILRINAVCSSTRRLKLLLNLEFLSFVTFSRKLARNSFTFPSPPPFFFLPTLQPGCDAASLRRCNRSAAVVVITSRDLIDVSFPCFPISQTKRNRCIVRKKSSRIAN